MVARGAAEEAPRACGESSPDHQMHVVKLAGDQPAVIPPFGQSFGRGAAHTRQGPGHVGYIVDVR